MTNSSTFTLKACCAVLLAAVIAGPAHAARPEVTPFAQVEDASGGSPVPDTPAKVTRYCLVETPTGSRMPKRICRTADEWKASGLDVTKGARPR